MPVNQQGREVRAVRIATSARQDAVADAATRDSYAGWYELSPTRAIAVTRDGKTITGRRLNEDTYTVQLIDTEERLVSLIKSELREYTVLKTSAMPSYKEKLTSADLDDLVAYLRTLKGAR